MIYVLSGEIESGKSSILLNWIKNRSDVYGMLTPRGDQEERFLLNVRTEEIFRMEADPWEKEVIEVGRYTFLKSAFEKANHILEQAALHTNKGYIIIDELGKLELRSEGLDAGAKSVISKTKNSDKLHSVLVIRTSLLSEILAKYNITEYRVISESQLPDMADKCNKGYISK